MTNPLKGEALVRVEAGDYTLAFTLGACIAIESQFDGRTLEDITGSLASADGVDLGTLLVVLWALLKKHHAMTLDEVEALITMPEIPQWTAGLIKALTLAQPEGQGKRPPKAAASA